MRGPGSAGIEAGWIVGIWRPYGRRLLLILLLTFGSTAVSVCVPLVLKQVFDGLSADLSARSLGRSVLVYFVLSTVEWALVASLVFSRGLMNMRFEWAARQRAYESLLRLGPGFFQRLGTGDLVTRLTDDVSEKLSWFLCSGILRAFAALVLVIFAVLMMVRLDPMLTLYTILPLPPLILLYMRAGAVLDRRFEAVQSRISAMNDSLEACFSGIRVVKAYGREAREEQAFERVASECRRTEIEAARSRILVDSLWGQVWQLGIVAVLLAGGAAVISGRMTLGTFVAFDAYVLLLVTPMLDFGTFFVRGRQSAVSITRLRELEEAQPEVPVEAVGGRVEPPARPHGEIRFESVTYTYPGEGVARHALEEVSLEVRPGEVIAVAGRLGSGKSTLLRLIPRLIDPTRGRILMDGIDLKDLPSRHVRSIVGYVPQEPLLFSSSIRENIRFAREWVDGPRLAEATRIARLETDLAILGEGLDTKVGVRGISLSGGQKQRVALARALAGRPRVLVLDDPTAALDAETEAALWEELHLVLPDLATVVVTHRAATLERADRIVVLEEGRVVETGTHADLSLTGRVYRALYRRHLIEERVGVEESEDLPPESSRESSPGSG